MKIIETKSLSEEQFDRINQLWNEEYPLRISNRLSVMLEEGNCTHYIVEELPGEIIAWASTFFKEDEIRFSIIVVKEAQGKGIGCTLIDKLKSIHHEFYGWVIDYESDIKYNGEKYRSPLPFYQKNGFETLSEQRIDNELINAVKIRWLSKGIKAMQKI